MTAGHTYANSFTWSPPTTLDALIETARELEVSLPIEHNFTAAPDVYAALLRMPEVAEMLRSPFAPTLWCDEGLPRGIAHAGKPMLEQAREWLEQPYGVEVSPLPPLPQMWLLTS